MINGPTEIEVVCDECANWIMISATEFAGDPPTWGVNDSDIETENWSITDEGTHLCEDCTEEANMVECETCQGTGKVENEDYDPDAEDSEEEEEIECDECGGEGKVSK